MTTTAQPTTPELGRSRARKEDARLITGRTRWTGYPNSVKSVLAAAQQMQEVPA